MSTPSPAPARPLPLQVVLQALLVLGVVVLGVWTLYQIRTLVFVLIAAALCAYVIAPLVHLAQLPVHVAGRSHRLPRIAAVALVYLVIGGSVAVAAAILLPRAMQQTSEIVARIPAYTQSIANWQHGWSNSYERLRIPIELRRWLDDAAAQESTSALEWLRQTAHAVAAGASDLSWLFLVPVLAFFLLKDAGHVRRAIVVALPFRMRLRSHRLLDDLNKTLAAYVRAQLLACLLVGVLCGVGFAVIGVPYAVLLGLLAAGLEFIPLVGPFLLGVIASVVGALHAPMLVAWIVGFLSVLRVTEDYVIYPRLIRRGIELHPLAVILGVMAGAELAGVAGMFLAVPTVAIATIVGRHWLHWHTADLEAEAAAVNGASHEIVAAPPSVDGSADARA
jgi:predicted PurR-regulated permease PerM